MAYDGPLSKPDDDMPDALGDAAHLFDEPARDVSAVLDGSVWKMIEASPLEKVLPTASHRRSYLLSLSAEQFIDSLFFVQAFVTNSEIDKTYYDVQPGLMMSTPAVASKGDLMRKTHMAVQRILKNPKYDHDEALKRAALCIAGSIDYIHPFKDGNGRTGRVVAYALMFGTEQGQSVFEQELAAIISKSHVEKGKQPYALYTTPPPKLERELQNTYKVQRPSTDPEYGTDSKRSAFRRIQLFHGVMEGRVKATIMEAVRAGVWDEHGDMTTVVAEHGSLSGYELYENDMLRLSEIPSRAGRTPTLPTWRPESQQSPKPQPPQGRSL